MRVRATKDGFYGGSRRRAGAEFVLKDPKHFSKNWMEEVRKAQNEAKGKDKGEGLI